MPCDYSRYPRDWQALRRRILERDGNRCRWCGVVNHAVGVRDPAGRWHTPEEIAEGSLHSEDAECRVITIVLTVAHLDHDPEHNAESNLAALCQRCHLGHDRLLHMLHARQTRERKTGQLALGLEAE